MLKKLLALTLVSGALLTACMGNSSTSNGDNTPVVQSQTGVMIDPMSSVPVLNGTGTKGTLYIHNYTDKTVSGINFNLNQATFTSQVKALIAKAGLNLSGGIEDKNGFVLLNSERCNTISANSSCAINFTTPNLSFGNQGSSLVSISYKLNNKLVTSSQIVNYNYIDTNSSSGVDFTGGMNVNATAGKTKYIVGYIYSGGQSGGLYKNVNLASSSQSVRINGGFINGQEVATSQVIAVEFAVSVQNNHKTYVNIVPTWDSATANISRSDVSNNSGLALNLTLDPQQDVANYLFGNVPILKAAPGESATISVVNNGNGDGTTLTAVKTGGETDGITIDISDCTASKLQANTNGTCNVIYTVESYTAGSTTVQYKDTNNNVVGSQAIYWTNNKPVPVVKLTRSDDTLAFAKDAASGRTVRFTLFNIGNAPLESLSPSISITGVSSVDESSSDCSGALGVNQSCYIDVTLTNATSGIGMLYVRALGQYNNINYSFASLPVSYMVTNVAALSITPSTDVTLNASVNNSATQTFTIEATLGSEPATITSFSLASMTTHPKPEITGGTCTVGTVLTSGGSDCTIEVTLTGTLSDESNVSGVTSLVIGYTGGVPSESGQATSPNINYSFAGNDSSLNVTSTASHMTGNGLESNPYSGREVNGDIAIELIYKNKSTNYDMTDFNIDTNNLPYGVVVLGDSDCPTQITTGSLAKDGTCTLRLGVDKSLLKISSQGGSVVLNFTTPPASWQTTLGGYTESFTKIIYANYLQPSVSFDFSQNNTKFESTVLTMTLANESAGTMPVSVNVSQVKSWLVNSPVSSTCTVNGDYSANCSLGGVSGRTASISYIMPNYLNLGESANIPLVYTTTNNIYLSDNYDLIQYLNVMLWRDVGNPNFTANSADYLNFAIDKSGTPYVAYTDNGGVTVMKFNNESWVLVGPARFAYATPDGGLSLAIDESGAPYVAYSDAGASGKGMVLKFNGSSWIGVGDFFSDGDDFYPEVNAISLAINELGIPYVAYLSKTEYENYYRATVRALVNNSDWVSLGGARFTGQADGLLQLTFDESQVPYFAYNDNDNNAIAVRKFSQGYWAEVGDTQVSTGTSFSLAINKSNTPYLAYQNWDDDAKLNVIKFENNNWVDVGGNGSSGTVDSIKLAFNSFDVPYVGYQDWANGYKATVVKFDEQNNNWINVGSPGFSPGDAWGIGLVINRFDIPYIAYRNSNNDNRAIVMEYK